MSQGAFISDLHKLLVDEAPKELTPGDITTMNVMQLTGWGWQKSKRKILAWAYAGKIVSVGKRHTPAGRVVDAWRLVEQEKEEN